MKPSFAPSKTASQSSSSASPDQPLTPFRWLVLLGFPPEVAAHVIAPEVFSAVDA